MRKIILLITSMFFSILTAMALNPVKTYSVTPADFGMTYEEVKFTTDDNLQLYGWLFKTSSPSTKVMIMSDDGNGNMADLVELASSFLSLGYNVLSYDYRGYGKSADFTINKNFYIYAQFQKDINAAIDYIKKSHADMPKIYLYGQGIGAGLSIAAGTNNKVGKVIADSPYSSFEEIKAQIKKEIGEEVMLPLGYNKVEIEPKYAIESKGAAMKILFIAGDKEKVYSPKYIKEIAKIREVNSTIFIVKGATQTNTFSINKETYFAEIKSFLGNK